MSCCDRVADVVLVCKRWSSLCLDNPPQQQTLALSLQAGTASAGELQGPFLEDFLVHLLAAKELAFQSQYLSLIHNLHRI